MAQCEYLDILARPVHNRRNQPASSDCKFNQAKRAWRNCMAVLDMASWLQVYDKHLSICTNWARAFRGFLRFCSSVSSLYTNAHAHKRGANVYVAEIISPYNGKKSSKISRRPPCSSPGFILLIISSLVPLCAVHSRHKTSASREEVFINISIYCVLKGHKQHILLSSWTNSFNSARKRASFQHTQLDKHIANSARQADRGS